MNSPQGHKNGMLAALHPSGTIHVAGVGSGSGLVNPNASTISVGMMSTDFKSTMKHNSSNNSIHSKKMVSTIRKPHDLHQHMGHQGHIKKSNVSSNNYVSPYS